MEKRRGNDPAVGISTGEAKGWNPRVNVAACVAVSEPHECPEDKSLYCSLSKGGIAVVVWRSGGGGLVDVAVRFSINPLKGNGWQVVDATHTRIDRLKLGTLKPPQSQALFAAIMACVKRERIEFEESHYRWRVFQLDRASGSIANDGAEIMLEIISDDNREDVLAETVLRAWFC
jgi:hypothetical protein